MFISGDCFCKKVSIEGHADLNDIFVCHCEDCQIFSGAPFRAVIRCRKENFKMKGSPREFVKIGGSGNKRIQGFCENCGTQIFASDFEKTLFNFRLGFLNQKKELIPKKHIFTKDAQQWVYNARFNHWNEEN